MKADPNRSALMQDQFDAILYLGPEYMQMRIGRMKISAGANAATAGAELQEHCSKLLAGQ